MYPEAVLRSLLLLAQCTPKRRFGRCCYSPNVPRSGASVVADSPKRHSSHYAAGRVRAKPGFAVRPHALTFSHALLHKIRICCFHLHLPAAARPGGPRLTQFLLLAGLGLLSSCNRSGAADSSAAPPLTTLRLDYAYYNPLSLVLKEKGWLEQALAPRARATWSGC